MAKRKNKPKLPVKFLVSMAGPDESYVPGQVEEFSEDTAIAFCTLPEEDPRAEPVGWDPAELLAAREQKKPAKKAGGKAEAATREKRETATPAAPETR